MKKERCKDCKTELSKEELSAGCCDECGNPLSTCDECGDDLLPSTASKYSITSDAIGYFEFCSEGCKTEFIKSI